MGVSPFQHIYDVKGSANRYGYTLDRVQYDFGMAVLTGMGWRLIAYVLLIVLNRDKQK
jgi:hypothetical protein